MVALGSVIGRRLFILPKRYDSWREYANLWGEIIGRPGVLKSPALREALRPLRELERDAAAVHESLMDEWQVHRAEASVRKRAAEQNALRAAKKGANFDARQFADDDAQLAPALRRFIVNNSSVEALGEILLENPTGTLVYQDELIGLLRLLDRQGNEGARAFYLAGWSGFEPYTFDRIGRGLNRRVDAVCLSLLGSIQPSVIGHYLCEAVNESGADGFMARFSVLVWPDLLSEWRNVDRFPNSRAYLAATDVFRRAEVLTAESVGAEVGEFGAGLRFDDGAQAEFESWREVFERAQRSSTDHPALVAHRDKYRKLVPALALICHVADCAAGSIGQRSLLRAIAWCEYLDSHARRAYASVARPDADGAHELLNRIRQRELPWRFRLRDVYRNGWSRLSEPERARRAVRMLVDFDYLAESADPAHPAGGRPTSSYIVNPKVYL
jgi:hypothetical protein